MLSSQGSAQKVQVALEMLGGNSRGDNLAVAKPLSRSLRSLYTPRS